MTLIDYAKYLLNVCGRRFTNLYRRHYLESTNALPSLSALLSYLRTQTASIFTQIKARGAVHPLSGLPTTETLATLPTAIATLSTRKVDVGTTTQIDDGVSLWNLLLSPTQYSQVTEIYDTNEGWVGNGSLVSYFLGTLFPNKIKVSLSVSSFTVQSSFSFENNTITHLRLPYLTSFNCKYDNWYVIRCSSMEELILTKCTDFTSGHSSPMFTNCPMETLYLPKAGSIGGLAVSDNTNLKTIIAPKTTWVATTVSYGRADNYYCIKNCTKLSKIVMGVLSSYNGYGSWGQSNFKDCTNLIHIEIGQGVNGSFSCRYYNPTKALMSDPIAEGYENLVTQSMVDDLNATLEEGQTQYTLADFPNNLALFIENFYIFFAKRLQSQTTAGAKTLTLSSAVVTALQNNTTKDGTNVYTYITSIKKWTIATA